MKNFGHSIVLFLLMEVMMNFIGTVFSLLPAIIAIVMALITKEVYLSLFIGIVCGSLMYCDFHIIGALNDIFETMLGVLSDDSHLCILIFLVFLGIVVALMSKAGGSQAYSQYVSSKIKTRKGVLFSIFGLGTLIFIDDYFNCLTVGSVMRDVSDRMKISRAKLAYIIDSTAAPICIIAPISSWAAAVTGYTSGDGFALFLQTIPFNLYALLTIVMIVVMICLDLDFGKMKEYEQKAIEGHIDIDDSYKQDSITSNQNGKVVDLILPIIFLIMSCILFMVYTGGFFEGVSFMEAFRNCNASFALVLGSFVTLVFMFVFYLSRRVLTYKDYTDCIPEGFKMMVSSIIILVLAWTLGEIVSVKLDVASFVKNMISVSSFPLFMIPAIFFIIAIALSFSTGTSWGTFSVLIPIVIAIFNEGDIMLVIAIAAILSGSVCGDHISPISDTTIMASAGAQCHHITHVETQLPYALIVAGASFVGYIVAGLTGNMLFTFLTSFVVLVSILLIIKKKQA